LWCCVVDFCFGRGGVQEGVNTVEGSHGGIGRVKRSGSVCIWGKVPFVGRNGIQKIGKSRRAVVFCPAVS